MGVLPNTVTVKFQENKEPFFKQRTIEKNDSSVFLSPP